MIITDVSMRRPVTVLRALADRWLIGDGLTGGERVVVEGLQRIRFVPGAPAPRVRFIERPAATPTTPR